MTLLTVFSDSFTGEQEGIIISGALDGLDVKLFIEDLNDAQAEDCPLTLRVVAWRQADVGLLADPPRQGVCSAEQLTGVHDTPRQSRLVRRRDPDRPGCRIEPHLLQTVRDADATSLPAVSSVRRP